MGPKGSASAYTKKVKQPPERLKSVTQTVKQLAAENLVEDTYSVTHDECSVIITFNTQSTKGKSWLPKTIRGVPIVKQTIITK
jgi:hypothetical protein